MTLGPAPLRISPTIRFADVDMMGHVNNARYVTYLEEARVHVFRELARSDAVDIRGSVILARTEIDYRAPLTLDDELIVELWVKDIGRSSFTMGYRILGSNGRVAAEAVTVQVYYDYAAEKSQAIPDDVRRMLQTLRPATATP